MYTTYCYAGLLNFVRSVDWACAPPVERDVDRPDAQVPWLLGPLAIITGSAREAAWLAECALCKKGWGSCYNWWMAGGQRRFVDDTLDALLEDERANVVAQLLEQELPDDEQSWFSRA